MADYDFTLPPDLANLAALQQYPQDQGALPTYLGQAMQNYQTGNQSPDGLPSYLSYAMANLQNPQPQTPMGQAMAPQAAPQQPSPMSAPQVPQGMGMSPIQAMFQKQATDPSLSSSNALIAAGSAMLGAKDFKEGLAAAGPAFSNTFDSTLNAQRDLNTPKVTPLADGSFSMVQMPGQQPQIVRNDQVAGFLLGKQQLINQAGLTKTLLQGNIRSQQQQEQDDRLNARDYQSKLVQTDTALAANQRALDVARDQAQNSPYASMIAGAFPGIAQSFGWDDARGNLVIQRATVDAALVQDALKKGAITDKQAGFLNSDVPSATASRGAVIVPWLEQQGEILQRIRDFQASQVAKANPSPPTGFSTTGTSNIGSGTYQPMAVTDAASYAALPSGTVFKAPDGTIRRKP